MRGAMIEGGVSSRLPKALALIALVVCMYAPGLAAAQGIENEIKDYRPAEGDYEEHGLLGPGEYESPQFGYTVEWDDEWTLDDYFDQPDEGLQPVLSDEDEERDSLYLMWSPTSRTWAYLSFVGEADFGGGPEAIVREWTRPSFISRQWPDYEVGVLLEDVRRNTGMVLYALDDGEAQIYIMYQAIELEDDAMIYVSLVTDDNSFEESFEQVTSEVEVNGDRLFGLFEWNDIEDAIDDAR